MLLTIKKAKQISFLLKKSENQFVQNILGIYYAMHFIEE